MNIKDKYVYNKLIEMGYIYKPRYNVWLSRTYWHPLDTACLLNGIDPNGSHVVEIRLNKENSGIEAKRMRLFDESSNGASQISNSEREIFNCFLSDVFEESEAIETWAILPFPQVVINTYLQKIGSIPNDLLKLAKKSFLELYQKRNHDEKTREYWKDNWHNNIAAPFLKLITDEDIAPVDMQDMPKLDQVLDKLEKGQIVKQGTKENEEKMIKIILDESSEAREERVRNRGYEVYKLLKEQRPDKKITKDTIAKQIMQEEESIYKLISTENPLKKQPALGTYLKELRKIH